jgi:hypothetical protein
MAIKVAGAQASELLAGDRVAHLGGEVRDALLQRGEEQLDRFHAQNYPKLGVADKVSAVAMACAVA